MFLPDDSIIIAGVLRRFFSPPSVPLGYRSNFRHLYFDIAWYGILAGSAINFQAVYAARLGASGFQIGLMSALPAMVSLMLAFPSGAWLEKRPIDKAMFRTSVFYRLGFLFWVFLPWLFDEPGQVWGLISLVLLQAIPLAALSVGFNALFASAVPSEWRAHVMGVRNVLVSITLLFSSLGCGFLLDRVPFPMGYQIVFAIGFLGAAMSSVHLYFVHPLPELFPVGTNDPQPAAIPQGRTRGRIMPAIRLDIIRSSFRGPLLVMLAFHLTQYLAAPIFPLYFVNMLHLTDEQIGIGTALFHMSVFLGSTQLVRVTRRMGHQKVSGLGAVGMSLYPILLSQSVTPFHYYLLSAVGGFAWAMVGGAFANYLLDKIPSGDRPAHLAWYNIILNIAILTSSLAGPWLAGYTGLVYALLLFGFLRLISGIVILKWG